MLLDWVLTSEHTNMTCSSGSSRTNEDSRTAGASHLPRHRIGHPSSRQYVQGTEAAESHT